jgi:hypothetical protein
MESAAGISAGDTAVTNAVRVDAIGGYLAS